MTLVSHSLQLYRFSVGQVGSRILWRVLIATNLCALRKRSKVYRYGISKRIVCGWEALSMTMMRYARAEAWKRRRGNSAWYQIIKDETTTVINIGRYAE